MTDWEISNPQKLWAKLSPYQRVKKTLNKDPSRQEWPFIPLLPAPSIPSQSSCELTSPLGTSGHHSPYLLCPMNRVPPLQEQTTHIRRYRNRTLCSMETELSVFGWRCHQKSRQSSYTVVQCLSCYWNKGQSVCLSLQTQIRHRFPRHKDQTPSSHHWERTRAQFYLTTQTFTGDHGVPCWTRLLPGSCREGQLTEPRTCEKFLTFPISALKSILSVHWNESTMWTLSALFMAETSVLSTSNWYKADRQ